MSALPLYQRARRQPENVRRVMSMVREYGLTTTLERVRGKLASGTPTGYSAAGRVVALGEDVVGFNVGDQVACAGAGIANHAEYIDVPVNLAVRVPEGVGLDAASTITLGAIAMQGVRRAAPTLGESIAVIGLGIIGQLTAQFLAANGCRVIGVDVDRDRIETALANGLNAAIDPTAEDHVSRILHLTGGFGADAVIITAAAASSDIINEAMRATRKKGRVVLVGDVGLNLNRSDFYPKELDLLVSTSYGPGRYDPNYEEGGNDYPLPYVRWTENRNMQAYLALLRDGRANVSNLISHVHPVTDAELAYTSLQSETPKPLIVLLQYPNAKLDATSRSVSVVTRHKSRSGALRVGLIGASSFAQAIHLPNLRRLGSDFTLHAVMSRTGSNARAVAEQYGAAYCTTDEAAVLHDPEVDVVFIASRHNTHGATVLRALHAGKHVFVEKPLTLNVSDIDEIARFYRAQERGPLLMVGYNRRFAPAITHCRRLLANRTTPLMVNYRMNAGYIAPDHWVQGPEGGGRNLGEACHIYDLFQALAGEARAVSVSAVAVSPRQAHWRRNDNFVATIGLSDGSVCVLTYTSMGAKQHSKEKMEIFADGMVLELDDYRALDVEGARHRGWHSSVQRKGHQEELEALSNAIRNGGDWPIPLDTLLATSRISFEVEQQINCQA